MASHYATSVFSNEVLINEISTVRYGALGKVEFDFAGETIAIKEPDDVLLVGYAQASNWIAREYGWLLQVLL